MESSRGHAHACPRPFSWPLRSLRPIYGDINLFRTFARTILYPAPLHAHHKNCVSPCVSLPYLVYHRASYLNTSQDTISRVAPYLGTNEKSEIQHLVNQHLSYPIPSCISPYIVYHHHIVYHLISDLESTHVPYLILSCLPK